MGEVLKTFFGGIAEALLLFGMVFYVLHRLCPDEYIPEYPPYSRNYWEEEWDYGSGEIVSLEFDQEYQRFYESLVEAVETEQ